jgi:anti-sigma B factor antagonist
MSGEVDIESAGELRAAAERVLVSLSPGDRLTMDMSAVTFIDSSGLGALIATRNAAVAAGCTLALLDLPAPVIRLFELTGLSEAFSIH